MEVKLSVRQKIAFRNTVFNVYKRHYTEMLFIPLDWQNLCVSIESSFKSKGLLKMNKVRQRKVFSKTSIYKKVVNQYPDEFVPSMVKIIYQHVWLAKRKNISPENKNTTNTSIRILKHNNTSLSTNKAS